MTRELYDLFEKKTGILMNKVLAGILSSKKEKEKFYKHFNSVHKLPILEAIPCSCDVLRAGGTYIFAEEKPEHPFTKILDKLATKIEKF